jgi:hypothetical protein
MTYLAAHVKFFVAVIHATDIEHHACGYGYILHHAHYVRLQIIADI